MPWGALPAEGFHGGRGFPFRPDHQRVTGDSRAPFGWRPACSSRFPAVLPFGTGCHLVLGGVSASEQGLRGDRRTREHLNNEVTCMLTRRQFSALALVTLFGSFAGGAVMKWLLTGKGARAEGAAKTEKVIRADRFEAREFRVVDDDGQTRANLDVWADGTPSLLLFDKAGKIRAREAVLDRLHETLQQSEVS